MKYKQWINAVAGKLRIRNKGAFMRKWITISYSWRYMIVIAIGHIAICVSIGWALAWFWHHEWVKPCKRASVCPDKEMVAIELDFNERDALYKRTQAVEAKHKTKKEKPVKIYQGVWRKDCLEVIGK